MSCNAADGAALVAAAVQAAVREGAPRRTIAAVAAAVAGTCLSAAARPFKAVKEPAARAQDAPSHAEEADDPAQLLDRLRAVRRAQRSRKKQRRREAKRLAQEQRRVDHGQPLTGSVDPPDGAAGQSAELRGASAAAPAPAPAGSASVATPAPPQGLPLQPLPQRAEDEFSVASTMRAVSIAPTLEMCPNSPAFTAGSAASSAGMQQRGRSAPYAHRRQ